MAWADWMVPELRPEEAFRLRALELELQQAIRHRPSEVTALCLGLAKQNAMQASIIRRATDRIAELELNLAIATTKPPMWRIRLSRWFWRRRRAWQRLVFLMGWRRPR
jgi:hypothetical protein